MCKVLIFGGTSEGRMLADFCAEIGLHAYVSVTTAYGAELLSDSECLHTIVSKMDETAIKNFISEQHTELVLDATHPYAEEATRNIANACRFTGIQYFRIVRASAGILEHAHYFDTIQELIAYLNQTDGNILITTGSKNLAEFCSIENYRKRCAIRVLPTEQIIETCTGLGFEKSRMITEAAPFTTERNLFHLKKFHVKFLVTKDSGTFGGFAEKAEAAKQSGAELLILKRPVENGIALDTARQILIEKAHASKAGVTSIFRGYNA